MGFFDSLNKVMNVASQIKDIVDDLSSNNSESAANNMNMSTINFSDSSRLVSCSDFADDENGTSVEYNISVMMNDSFKEAKSGACEVSFLYTYAPGKEYGDDDERIRRKLERERFVLPVIKLTEEVDGKRKEIDSFSY